MLAGLLFATTDADDRPDSLAATLPIGGVTLIAFQARLLVAAGATQIVIVVSRLTPELLGAVNRLTRRGVAVDTVRGPAEALAKLHPLARVLWLADGLVTTGAVIEALRDRNGDALLVAPEGEELERIGPNAVWAGAAAIDPQRIADVAKLPSEYDFASALLRATAQHGAEQVPLPDTAVREGHGIQHSARALVAKGRSALTAALGNRANWVDRFLLAPLARLVLPPLVARGLPAIGLAAFGTLLSAAGLGAIALGWCASGLGAVVVALALLGLADLLGWLRDERMLVTILRWLQPASVVLAVLILGWQTSVMAATQTALLLAGGTVIAGALAERAAGATQRRLWWAIPTAYPLILLPAAIAGYATVGLAVAGAYATVSLGFAIEALRVRIAG